MLGSRPWVAGFANPAADVRVEVNLVVADNEHGNEDEQIFNVDTQSSHIRINSDHIKIESVKRKEESMTVTLCTVL